MVYTERRKGRKRLFIWEYPHLLAIPTKKKTQIRERGRGKQATKYFANIPTRFAYVIGAQQDRLSATFRIRRGKVCEGVDTYGKL